MPRLTRSVPKYQKHRASKQAVVTLDGQDFYLGPHGTKASHYEYDRLITEWLANGRHLPAAEVPGITVSELAARYWKFAKGYYRKDGKPTDTITQIKVVLRILRELYGRTPATDFGPSRLKAVRQKLIDGHRTRLYINKLVGILCRVFKWAAIEELIPVSVHDSIRIVPGLRKGRSTAPEGKGVRPVAEADVQAVLPHLAEIVADMVRLQRATGCRPAECCIVRPCDVDRSGEVWEYRPESHKVEHHGKERVIFIGPRGQAILAPYLLREADAYCFSPIDAEKSRLAERHAKRKTPPSCGNSPGTNRRRKPRKTAGDHYTTASYRRAIHGACDKAGIARWGPNRLRHSAGTEVRQKFGLEAAQVALGHAKADVTQIYAERDHELAREVARKIG